MRYSSSRPHGIDPRVDVVFHRLLGSPENEDILVAFLNDILDEPTPIREAKVKNPFAPGLYRGERAVVLDVLAVDEKGHQQALEMQRRRHPGLQSRMVYGQSRAYAGQLKKGQTYRALRPTTSIWLCAEDVFPDLGALLRFRIREAQGTILEAGWRIEVLQLAKWVSQRQALLAERFAPWYAFFNEAASWTEVPANLTRPELEKAMHVLEDFQKDPMLDELYRGRLEYERIRLTEQEYLEEQIRAREAAERASEADKLAREAAERASEADRLAREEADRGRQAAERTSEADRRDAADARAEVERLEAELRELRQRLDPS